MKFKYLSGRRCLDFAGTLARSGEVCRRCGGLRRTDHSLLLRDLWHEPCSSILVLNGRAPAQLIQAPPAERNLQHPVAHTEGPGELFEFG